MADDDVGSALTGLLAQFAQRVKKPEVIEGYTPNQGQSLLDRRNDKAVVLDPDEFTPFWQGAADFYHVPESMTRGVPGPHTNNPLAKQLGYNDIKKPSPAEVNQFRADVAALSPKRAGGEGDADPAIDDPIQQLLRHLQEIDPWPRKEN